MKQVRTNSEMFNSSAPTTFAPGCFTSSRATARRCTTTNHRRLLVIDGKCSVKGIQGDERVIEKNDIVFLPAKEYYQLTSVGPGALILFGNRSEPFGVRPVRAEEASSK